MCSIAKINAPTVAIKTIWNVINTTTGEEIEHAKLIKLLSKTLPSNCFELCEEYVAMAVMDRLVLKSTKAKMRSRQKTTTVYRLPNWREFTFSDGQADFWCYECHTTGDILQCEGCCRSFHERCCKTIEEKQLELEQFVPKQKRITISSFGTRSSSVPRRQSTLSTQEHTHEERNSSRAEMASPLLNDSSASCADDHVRQAEDVSIVEEASIFPATDAATEVKHETFSEESVKQEEDRKDPPITMDEPQFVCVVRPPDRRLEERLNTPSIKPEESDTVESGRQGQEEGTEQVQRFCYACRLLKNSSNNAPPHVGKEELNYLLKFIIEQYKSWLPEDTFSLTKLGNGRVRQTPAWDRKTIDLCKAMFLRQSKSLAYIRQALADERYNTLDEFHVDLLDVAHNVAIIHGVTSLEYDAMMYFLADCVYDLFEIRQCPDCYRHSNEKDGPDFFARPCRTRHELVYAKQKSYQYWPAKVIRVVNNKYDVRFFGDKHLRALVDASCVKPIDTEPRSLKINLKHRGFQLATEELLKHQALLDVPREAFAFGSIPPPAVTAAAVVPYVANTATSLGIESHSPARLVVAHRMKRAGKPSQPNQPLPAPAIPHIPLAEEQSSLLGDVYNASQTNASPKGRALKRQVTTPRNQPAKTARNSDTTNAPTNQPNQPSAPASVALQQNNNTISNNFNGHSVVATTPGTPIRLPRTKQNLKQMFAEQSSPNKLKAILDQTNDVVEIKQAALRALQENEERSQRKINLLKETHSKHISETKKKQWCASCETESHLPCCWNTSYCSQDCQLQHWPLHRDQHKV